MSYMLKRDFSRPRAVFASPTRNLDAAITKPGISPMVHPVSVEVDAFNEPGPQPRENAGKPGRSGTRLK